MQQPTPKQQKILDFIEQFTSSSGYAPSFQEIQNHFGFASPNAATKHVQALVKKGLVQAGSGKSRQIRSLRPLPSTSASIPLVGSIAAGIPIEAIENIETHFDLSSFGIDNSDERHFALRVRGESMIEAGIFDSDIAIIKKQPTVTTSDIAAVVYNGEATLKYVEQNSAGILLVPANAAMSPIAVFANEVDEFRILGKLILSFRWH